ncbi:response regulator [Blastopirellula sp. JC732]|uniref:Response regulator n=1 Tax=Blastopirellula sediminis TaxID=2894196 RepID=A0A9X1SHJ7_9BACT|nr:response regulator [Blastopirellula sediminis]MCC9606178.1 response regulator [Blastopirellula sediminis]MCC9630523.1 response regulator [Blastopirellula sediminis]
MIDEDLSLGAVYVVEDNDDTRKSIEWTLTSVGYSVQVFADAKTFLDRVDSKSPCCVVVDLLLPGMTGLSLCQELNQRVSSSAVVMISGHGDVKSAVEAMKQGVVDFLEKPFGREQLLTSVHDASRRAKRHHRETLEEARISEGLATLSPRELEVFGCIADGLVTKQIAAALAISPRTVDVHRSKIAQKLELDSPTQMAHVISVHKRQRDRKIAEE